MARHLTFRGVWTWAWRRVAGVVRCAGLVVFLVACTWWVRSYFATDTARLQGRDGYLRVIFHHGAAHLTSYREDLHGSYARLVFATDDRPEIPDQVVRYVYPEGSRRREPEERWVEHPGRAWEGAVPLWAIAVTAGVLPAAWAVRRRRASDGLPPMNRPSVRQRVGRFLVTASAWACVLSAAGWVETMRWRGFGLNWRTSAAVLEMESTTGVGSLRVNIVWRPRPPPKWASHDDLQGWGRERPSRGIGAHRVWFPPDTHIDSPRPLEPFVRPEIYAHDDTVFFEDVDPAAPVPWGLSMELPYWLLVPLTAALPVATAWRRRRAARRAHAGACAHCGYDLRATPGRCPECGRATAR